MEKKKRYLLYWAVVCLLVFIIGAAIPRSEMRSLGLEGANQANLTNPCRHSIRPPSSR